jgi:glutamyl-tRNA synthetase
VRTALFNWLYARKHGGAFLIRIEDTDRQRSSDEHTLVILDGFRWLGLDWNEDIVFQGDGLERHQALADRLVESGHAYLDEGAVRFRMPTETIAWDDIVHGTISFEGSDIPDWVILRSDRTPTYNFSVVADDIDMRISHVLRGDDHISNTPKQIAVYNALGQPLPLFGHVPNVHGTDGKKLSKRHGATAIGDYQEQGFLPAAMCNFLALLGWSPGNDQELFYSLDELTEAFSLEGVQKKSAVFDPQKLEWMNGQHISHTPSEALLDDIKPILGNELGLNVTAIGDEQLLRAVTAAKVRARLMHDLGEKVAVRLDARFIERDEKANKFIAKDPQGFSTALGSAQERLSQTSEAEWEPEPLEQQLRSLAEDLGLGLGKIMQPIRIALTGSTVSEAVNELLWVVGREESLSRMKAAQKLGVTR